MAETEGIKRFVYNNLFFWLFSVCLYCGLPFDLRFLKCSICTLVFLFLQKKNTEQMKMFRENDA